MIFPTVSGFQILANGFPNSVKEEDSHSIAIPFICALLSSAGQYYTMSDRNCMMKLLGHLMTGLSIFQ